jgi:hypothetical protein
MDAPSPLGQFRPTCKVCERGALVPKKIYRMSGPVVAIGFILLIPSVLGMIASALMFFGVIAYKGDEANSSPTTTTQQLDTQDPSPQSDDEFRRDCASGVIEGVKEQSGGFPTLSSVVHICDCSLDGSKQGNFSASTTEACAVRWLHADDQMPDPKTKAPYIQVYKSYVDPLGYQDALARAESTEQPTTSPTAWFHVLGGTFAIALGIISFVGGLLGWLLVMKKHVLRCSVCSATVNAS